MTSFRKLMAGSIMLAVLVGACSSAAATPTAPLATDTPAAATPAPVASDTGAAPSTAPVAGSATVLFKAIGSDTVMVAGSNGMTVYTYTKDVADSGASTCTGGCLTKWPAVTVPAGTTPTPGDGVTGKLGTITRTDDGTIQVTYNGLPLYFYQNDTAPGQTNGSYTNWNLVKP